MKRTAAVFAAAVLAAALLATACAGPTTTPARRYVGTTTPTTPGPLCPASKAEAQVRNGGIIFAPDDGTWLLEGVLSPDGTIAADKTSLGANKQPWSTTFEGRWTAATITGTYKTPRCTFAVALSSG